jgi:hypothetical protein
VEAEIGGELAYAPEGYGGLIYLLVGNLRRGNMEVLAFSQLHCPFIWFAWLVKI